MNKQNKVFTSLLMALVLICVAATPSFQSFMTSQFAIIGNKVSIKSHAYVTNMHAYGRIEFPSASGSSNYIFTAGDSLMISNAQNSKAVAAYGDTVDAWFFYSPLILSGSITAPSFIGDGSQLTGVAGSGIASLSGKGTGNVLRVGVFQPSNGLPSKITYTEAGTTNIITSGLGVSSGSNIFGFGSITGITDYANQVFASLFPSNATASRLLVTGADGGVTNSVTTAAEAAFLNGVTSALQTQLDAKGSLAALNSVSNGAALTSNQMVKSLSGSSTNQTIKNGTIGVSAATPSTLAWIDANTNAGSTSISLSSATNIYGVGDYTGATIRVKQVFSSLNASNATASKLAYIGADQGVTNTGINALLGTNLNGIGSLQAAGSVTGANFFGVNQGVGASITLAETSAVHAITLLVPNIVRSNMNIQYGSNGMRGNFSGMMVYTNLDTTGTNIEMALRALSGVTDDGITLTFGGGGAIATAGGSGTNNKLATATIGVSNAAPSVLTATDAGTNIVGTGIGLTTSSNLAGIGGITMGGGLTNVGAGSNFVDSLQIGTNKTDLLFWGGVGSSNGLIRMQGADLPKFEFLTGNTNVSAPITYAHTSSNKLGVYNINQWESGTTFHNRGASVGMTNELPPGPTNGIWFKFLVATNKALWVHGSNAFIRMGTIGSTTNNGYINSALQGSYVWLEAISSNEWLATSISVTNGAAATTNYTWAVQ